jgi:HEAT repeat protein
MTGASDKAMTTRIISKLSLLALLFAPFAALASIESHVGNEPVKDPGWPEGALAVANLPSRVGWWERSPDEGGLRFFLYRGDAKALSELLTNFVAIRAPALELTIHDGPLIDKQCSDQRADWELLLCVATNWERFYNGARTNDNPSRPRARIPVQVPRIDLYLGGGQVDWSQVKVPNGIQIIDQRFRTVIDSQYENNAPQLSLTISCTNTVLKAGDEIPIEFVISNRGPGNYEYADRNYDRSGRMDEYKLKAKTEAGEAVPDPRAKNQMYIGGGLYQNAILQPGQSFNRTIPLNRWALVKERGRYTVTGSYTVARNSMTPTVITSEPITVTVSQRSGADMEAYIGDLTNRLAALPAEPDYHGAIGPTPDVDELVRKLMYTCDPGIVPALLHSMAQSNHGGFWESEALLLYVPHTDAVRKEILDAASRQGLGSQPEYLLYQYDFPKAEVKPLIQQWLSSDNPMNAAFGASLASKYFDDGFTPRLIAIATNTAIPNRANAITALAYNRTDEGVRILKVLLNDPDPKIWVTLADALLNAYQRSSVVQGRPLRQEDITAEEVKPLIRHLLESYKENPDVITGVSLEAYFASGGFTQQLIPMASDPRSVARTGAIYALAMNRTEEGVRTLKALLHDRDPEIRKSTEQAIRGAYTSRGNARGESLKPGDFDASYRTPEKP